MRVLCTGAAGYLGTTLCPMLLDAGHHVTALDRFPQGMPFLAACCADPKFDVIAKDVRLLTSEALWPFDSVINLAALVGAPVCDRHPDDARAINEEWPEALVSMAHERMLIIQPTSDSGYGVGYETNACTEDHPLNPTSIYARTKVAAEKHVLGAGGISFRLASVFGASPRMRKDLIANEFVWRAMFDRSVVLFEGHFRRNFVHVRDVAAAFMMALDSPESMRGQAFNCGATGQMMTKRELCERIALQIPGFEWYESATGFDADRRDFVVSNEKLESKGWKARYTIDAGISELIKVYKTMNLGAFSNA